MITRAQRLELFASYARERDCALCKDWPRAEKAARRLEVDRFPKGICARCDLAFWQAICVQVDSEEELEAFKQATREERSKPRHMRRHNHELLQEIRSKARKH